MIPLPKYETLNQDKYEYFRSIVTFNGSQYTSTYWWVDFVPTFFEWILVFQIRIHFFSNNSLYREKNKKFAEQGAAAVCLQYLKQQEEDDL